MNAQAQNALLKDDRRTAGLWRDPAFGGKRAELPADRTVAMCIAATAAAAGGDGAAGFGREVRDRGRGRKNPVRL